MKKVLIFAPTAPTSGITQYILNILSKLQNDELCFDVLSFHNDRLKRWAQEHNRVYYELDISMYKHPILYRKFLKKVFTGGYDAVHFNCSSISTLTIFKYAKKCGVKKIIMHSHSSFTDLSSKLRKIIFSNLHKILRIFANRYFDVRCACSVPAANWMYGEKRGAEALILNNAIDTMRFSYSEENRNEIRTQNKIKTKYVIGHIGRFTISKNHNYIAEIFSELCKIRDDCTLMLIGQGELLNTVKQRVSELGLNDNVVFLDFNEDIEKYYSAMDVFLMPSIFEGLPITLVESQANGLKSLVSDVITEKSDLTGLVEFYSLSQSAENWAKRLCEKLSDCKREETAEKIADKGFSLSAQAKELAELYLK